MTSTRKSKKLSVYVVEEHHNVVPFIHRAIASKLLPYSGIPMIHLDSHPDLLLPINMPADLVFQPQELYESLSIENWLLPLVYAKHLDHIVWVKPPWAQQIQTPEASFKVGKCSHTGKIRLSSKENYFLTDGLFRPTKDLMNSSDVKLTIVELLPDKWSDVDEGYITPNKNSKELEKIAIDSQSGHLNNSEEPHNYAVQLQDIVKDKPYILDIDLDFFSTANPFRGLLQEEEEKALKRLYHYPALSDFSDESIMTFTHDREQQLNKLQDIFSSLESEWSDNNDISSKAELESLSLSELTGLATEELAWLESQKQDDLKFLCQKIILDEKDKNVTFTQVHDFGCTLDDTELPHHISTREQIGALESTFRTVLETLPKPAIVTISRSSDDGYCPKDVIEQCQRNILKLLEEVFGVLQISKDYE